MKKAPTKNIPSAGLTLDQYAKAKGLPVEFLKRLGLAEIYMKGDPAVRIPYFNEDGEEIAVRFRLSMEKSEQRFAWKNGSKPHPYGLRDIDAAREADHISLVEGESDYQTLRFNDVPALGLPGANSWKPDWEQYLQGISVIYVVIEPDKGGETILKWIAGSAIRDRVKLIRLADAKDPSELYLKNPNGFRKAWAKAVAEAQAWSELEAAQTKEKAKSAWKDCKELAEAESILYLFAEAFVGRGVIGVTRRAKLLYLVLTSRLLKRIVSAGIKGPSSGGKSFLLDNVLAFFPPEAYYILTAMSDKALAYSDEPLKHRFVVLYEGAALNSEWAAYFVRSLMSEGRLIYETVEKTPTGMRARRIEREGPTGLLTTTTAVSLHNENETRFLSLRVNDTPEQTKRIIDSEARKAAGEFAHDPASDAILFKPWHALQNWLAQVEHRVVVPFAIALGELVPPAAVRLRRDFMALTGLIQAHALLHQAMRDRDEKGRIIATLDDYEEVRVLVQAVMAEATERSIAENLRETVKAVNDILVTQGEQEAPEPAASIKDIAKELGLDRSAASRRVHDCVEHGFLDTTEPIKKGRPIRVVLGEPLPKNQDLLPSLAELRKQLKKRAIEAQNSNKSLLRGGEAQSRKKSA